MFISIGNVYKTGRYEVGRYEPSRREEEIFALSLQENKPAI
jgi:hypothetical protein